MQVQLQEKRPKDELGEFRKMHSEAFIYFLEEYEKFVELKRRAVNE